MKHDYSYEKQIFDNSVQFVESITTDFNTVSVIFQNMNNGNRKKFEVLNFDNFSIILDDPNLMMDSEFNCVQQTLIGLNCETQDNKYIYCIKTDDYEVVFQSNNTPKIESI